MRAKVKKKLHFYKIFYRFYLKIFLLAIIEPINGYYVDILPSVTTVNPRYRFCLLTHQNFRFATYENLYYFCTRNQR